MKLIVNKYINARIEGPSTDASCLFYKVPGDTIEVDNILIGTEIEGNNIWYKNNEDNCFYWSGGIQEDSASYFKDFGINNLWIETRGNGVKVFVIDSGFTNSVSLKLPQENLLSLIPHSDINDKIGHGSLMSGIIAGNDCSNPGIAVNSQIFSIKITDTDSNINNTILLQALNKVSSLINPEDYCVVNLSLTLGIQNQNNFDLINTKLLQMLDRGNLAIVAAVGNNSFYESYKTFPALVNNIISVAGLNTAPSYQRLTSSNYWDDITIAAPGDFSNTSLKTVFPRVSTQGSSHATAFISGIAALILSKARIKNKNLDSNYLHDFFKNASSIKTEVVSGRTYTYTLLDKQKLINQFKTI